MTAKQVFISGKVQNVWYRHWTQQQARELSLSGWVRNRSDGRVEAVISGEPAAVEEMLKRFHVGPPDARVTGVEPRDWTEPVEPGFREADTV